MKWLHGYYLKTKDARFPSKWNLLRSVSPLPVPPLRWKRIDTSGIFTYYLIICQED